ncbi:MAG: hypothetical protein JHC61_10070 [Burkholderiaceae bacterium]|nr:hypothetical protein [Burkholderiaceae bacterium]
MSNKTQFRNNYFYKQPGENCNVHPVISHSALIQDSIGFKKRGSSFFEKLGHEGNPVGSLRREAEQLYLLQGMVKGAIYEAASIANRHNVGIAVRPTGVLAHPGIESGDPTKAQEFKNKTSKDEDLFLCDELEWHQLGAVVHYDPRVGWTSASSSATNTVAKLGARMRARFKCKVSEVDWRKKREHIEGKRLPELERQLGPDRKKNLKFWPKAEEDWKKLHGAFKSRAAEYDEEDYDYRYGHYSQHATIVGPFVRLAVRPRINMVGDHDLFGFTKTFPYGVLTPDNTLTHVQEALQQANQFQAQHGGIWNWQPSNPFNCNIKQKIMAAHSQANGEPLLYFLPENRVHAVFYINESECLKSVWEYPQTMNKYIDIVKTDKQGLKRGRSYSIR